MSSDPGAAPSLCEQPAALEFGSDRLPWQRSLRWGEPPRNRRRVVAGLLAALLATVLQLVGFGLGMRSYRVHPPASPPIQVVTIDLQPLLPVPPEPVPPQIVARPSRIAVEPPRAKVPPPVTRAAEDSDAMRARMGSAGAAAMPQLFNPDGSIRVGGAAPVAPAAPKTQREAALARWAGIEKGGKNLLDCHKSRFSKGYALDESVGSGIARKYLSWVGLYDPHDTQKRAQRADAGCEPAE